jgi:hypothetical protein
MATLVQLRPYDRATHLGCGGWEHDNRDATVRMRTLR